MRKLILLLVALTTFARADSPLTSTEFWTAYKDFQLIPLAAETHKLDKTMAAFLSNPKIPIDRKAALINALGWNIDGQHNAAAYRAWLGRKTPTAAEQFCLGYLTAMDDYNTQVKALPMLQKARQALPQSYTVALVTALVECQQYVGTEPDTRKRAKIWPTIQAVNQDKSLAMDLRPQAKAAIMSYMQGYAEYK